MARFISHYEVIRELGSGHFGTVYLAVGDTPGRGMAPGKRRMVAIKKLKDVANHESVDLLLQEFALLDQVKHRSIVRVFEYLHDENAVVMEFIHGRTLRQVLEELEKAREQFFTESAVEIGCELADALYQAFTTPGDNGEPLRLVHRDLKPDNVILTPSGDVKILDFGLARVDNADFAKDDPERIKGTPVYMAPEQARGEQVDHRTDLFALGLILYELLENKAAYRVPERSADPVRDVLAAIEAGELSEQCAELELHLPALGPIITRVLQARPQDRYQNGQDLLVELRRQLYRDRGAYLQEFCEFFFGSICDIGDAPTMESVGASGGRTASPGRSRRKSIEERLRDSMAAEKQASTATRSSRSAAERAPHARTAPSRPLPAAPAASSAEASPGASMASNSSGGKPPRPPVGGGASRAKPFTPSTGGRGSPLKQVGQRSPDETGMLEMVPLSSNEDEAESGADPSATAFFAIPAPKAERSKPLAAPPPPGGGRMGGPPGMAPPGPPQSRPPYGSSPMGGPSGVAAPGMGGPPPQPLVQGPVASYGGGPGAASPFQVQGPQGAPMVEAGQRVQSNRIYAILFGLFLMAGVAVVAAVWLRPTGDDSDPGDDVASAQPVGDITGTAKGTKKNTKKEDTGIVDEAPAPKPRSSGRRSSGSSSGSSTSSSSSASSAKTSAPAPAAGTVTVNMSDPAAATSVEIVCPSGIRSRSSVSGGRASFSGIPGSEQCTLYFKGGAPAQYGPVSGGKSLNCTIVGTTAVCK